MKLYFAKYLPVEGEIVEGSMVKTMGEVLRSFQTGMNKRAYQLYKLFLCSRDIQVGGNFYTDDGKERGEATTVGEYNVYNGGAIRFPIEKCFKVLGPISPEATWVMEGDEFEEDQIARHHICYDSDGNIGYCFHCQRSMGCDSEDYDYFIKGPCGHFH